MGILDHFSFKTDLEQKKPNRLPTTDYQELEDNIQDEDVKFLLRKYKRKHRGRKPKDETE